MKWCSHVLFDSYVLFNLSLDKGHIRKDIPTIQGVGYKDTIIPTGTHLTCQRKMCLNLYSANS